MAHVPEASGSARRASSPADFPFELGAAQVQHGKLRHDALIIRPKSRMVIGRERLAELAESRGVNAVERRLIDATGKSGARVVILRAADDDGNRLWEIDEEIPDSELPDAGYILSWALLPLHRRLAAAGAVLMVHTEWGYREAIAFRNGTDRLLRERAMSQDASRDLDLWLLKNMLLHVQLGVGHVLESLLPAHLPLIDRRLERIAHLLAGTPAEALA